MPDLDNPLSRQMPQISSSLTLTPLLPQKNSLTIFLLFNFFFFFQAEAC